MKFIQLSLIAALAVSAAAAGRDIESEPVIVETSAEEKSDFSISANMTIASNYVWRGMTQSNDSPALQGGVDLEYKGLYLGTWGSNVDFGDDDNSLEADFYAGYKGELAGIGFDVGIIQYAYPGEADAYNFKEAYFGVEKEFDKFSVSAKYSWGLDDTPDDWEVGASVELPMEIGLEGVYGDHDTVGTYYAVALTRSFGKFDLSIGYTNFSADTDSALDEDHVIGLISTSF